MKRIYKILTVVGTRPEIIKLSSVIKKFDKYFNHILVHTGQNYDYTLNEIFFKDLKRSSGISTATMKAKNIRDISIAGYGKDFNVDLAIKEISLVSK